MEHTNLMDTLKAAISERHARMETMPFISALTTGQLPFESYVGQLRAMAVIQGTLEHELGKLPPGGHVPALLLSRPSRLVHLRRDLSIIDPLFVPDIAGAVQATRTIAERIRRYRVEQPGDLIGILYVMEGTTLGNAVHLADVLRSFSERTGGAAHFYNGYGDMTAQYWGEFSCVMNTMALNEAERLRIIQVTHEFFDQLEALFMALYPLEVSDLTYTAGMLNPEAGDHAVPGDVKELEAAVSAARRCREEFPYFEERYQERGRSFAKSDAAWLVTLTELPAAQLMGQVEWLGRVLGNRGMPRITLERQLELLYEELAAAHPAEEPRYRALREAAGSLTTERLARIPQASCDELTQAFHSATDGELQGRLKQTGQLIASAVADEAAGISAALSSLLTWLTDGERFTEAWCAAVARAVTESRAALRG